MNLLLVPLEEEGPRRSETESITRKKGEDCGRTGKKFDSLRTTFRRRFPGKKTEEKIKSLFCAKLLPRRRLRACLDQAESMREVTPEEGEEEKKLI